MVRYAAPLLSNEPTNVYEYGLSHPTTVPGNSSQILSAAKSSTHLFLVGVWLFSECTTHYTDPRQSVSAFSVMFITGISTATAFQLSSTNVERLRLI